MPGSIAETKAQNKAPTRSRVEHRRAPPRGATSERVQGMDSDVDACGRQAVLAEWKNEGVELAVESSRVG